MPLTQFSAHQSAPHYADREQSDRTFDIELGAWPLYIECTIDWRREHLERLIDDSPVNAEFDEVDVWGMVPVLQAVTFCALVWLSPTNPIDVREVPFVPGGELLAEIERHVSELLATEKPLKVWREVAT